MSSCEFIVNLLEEHVEHHAAIAALHRQVFGVGAFTRMAYRLREEACEHVAFGFVAFHKNNLIGSVRYSLIKIGDVHKGLLLGPLAVSAVHKNRGVGSQLITFSLERLQAHDFDFIMLIGDLDYYERFGFERLPQGSVQCPAPVDSRRLLVKALKPFTFRGKVKGVVPA